MKGILLAGGNGSRLRPITRGVSKQLLPVYDKPLIYYPLSVLMLADVREILVVTTPEDSSGVRRLLGDGSRFGINLEYKIQERPRGIADALIIGADFVQDHKFFLVLGDNIFYGNGLSEQLSSAASHSGSTIFVHPVQNPSSFGVVTLDESGGAISVEEKPSNPKGNHAITGLYCFNSSVCDVARDMKPSSRGELEITDVVEHCMIRGQLNTVVLGRGYAWLDAGTVPSLMQAGRYIEAIETRQGYKVACLEEIAWRNGWITEDTLAQHVREHENTTYGKYLSQLAEL